MAREQHLLSGSRLQELKEGDMIAGKADVLIVDDDINLADTISDILMEKGYTTLTTHSAEEALKKMGEMEFAVVLIDIKLPVMNGVEAFKRIKEISPKTAVIMMTAFSVEELIKDALQKGAYGVLNKPLDIEKVITMIEAAKADEITVLVVDEDVNTQRALRDILESKGYAVAVAGSGEEAIEIIKRRPKDIVFIDLKLPLLNGLETGLVIRKINPKIAVVIMTAFRQEFGEMIEQALNSCACCCIYKPFDPKQVADIAEAIVKKIKE